MARIVSAELTEKNLEALDLDSQELDRSFGIFKGPPHYMAEIVFKGTAAELIRNQVWHKDQKIIERGDEIALLLPFYDDRELNMKINQNGSQAKVLKPQSLLNKITKEVSRLTDLYPDLNKN